MNRLKRALRLVALILTMLLAAAGAGAFGAILTNNTRHKYEDVTVKIEMVDEQRNDEDELDVKEQE